MKGRCSLSWNRRPDRWQKERYPCIDDAQYNKMLPVFEAAMEQIMEVIHMSEARLHDGSTIEIEIAGEGPTLLLPVNPRPVEGPQAEQMLKYGVDPALGQSLIEGLRDAFRVVVFDYEGHVLG